MGLYDGYKLSNSNYISQYVGNIVPELASFSAVISKRYNDARDTDDALLESLGNLQHLSNEEDTAYANELKQNYVTKLTERAGREDYENMGRRTKRDAQTFGSDYSPLINRMKGMSAIQERVTQDKDIFDPNTKQRILGKIAHMNKAQKDPQTGDFVRGADGKIKLGAIQDWSYAKDIDIDKKNAEILKELETIDRQSGYSTSADGKMLQSVSTKVRSPEVLARLAKERMQNDPEIKAMVERDVELATYAYTPQEFKDLALSNPRNKSILEQLKGQGDKRINDYLTVNKISKEAAAVNPVEKLRQDYAAKGRNPDDAYKDYVRHNVREQIMDPHISFIANLLKIDKMSIDAKVDPDYAATATANAMQIAEGGNSTVSMITPDNGLEQMDFNKIHNTAMEAEAKIAPMKSNLQAAIGSYLGMPKPGMNSKELANWDNKTSGYLGNPKAQGDLIQKLVKENKLEEANNLSAAFREYNQNNNKALIAKQQVETFTRSPEAQVVMQDLYKRYQNGFSGEAMKNGISPFLSKGKLSYEEFSKDLLTTPIKSVFGSATNSKATIFDRGDESRAMSVARAMYFEDLGKVYQANGKTARVANRVFEPTGPGYIKQQTDYVESGIRNGTFAGAHDMATGELVSEILRKEAGTSTWFGFGKNDKQVSDKDKADPKSAYNQARNNYTVRINMDQVGANGETTATLRTADGSIRTIAIPEVSNYMPLEMSVRALAAAGKNMTKGEASYMQQNLVMGAGYKAITHLSRIDLLNSPAAGKPYQLNDMYFMKVSESGVKGMGKQKHYSLFYRDADGSLKPTQVKNRTNVDDLVQVIGGQAVENMVSNQTSDSFIK